VLENHAGIISQSLNLLATRSFSKSKSFSYLHEYRDNRAYKR